MDESPHSRSASALSASGRRSSIPASRPPAFYKVLEKLRSGEPLSAKEKQIHDQGLVTALRQIHDELDEAVLEAYGWGISKRKGAQAGRCSSTKDPQAARLWPLLKTNA